LRKSKWFASSAKAPRLTRKANLARSATALELSVSKVSVKSPKTSKKKFKIYATLSSAAFSKSTSPKKRKIRKFKLMSQSLVMAAKPSQLLESGTSAQFVTTMTYVKNVSLRGFTPNILCLRFVSLNKHLTVSCVNSEIKARDNQKVHPSNINNNKNLKRLRRNQLLNFQAVLSKKVLETNTNFLSEKSSLNHGLLEMMEIVLGQQVLNSVKEVEIK
jgi:hypothetical protein